MSKFDTRQKMVLAAIDLFHRQGVTATSVDQILDQSGTGKSQFSHYFKTKNGLIQAALMELRRIIGEGDTGMGYDIKTWKDMNRWFQTYIDFQNSIAFERSCPIGTIGGELSGNQPQLRKEVLLFLEWSRGRLTRFFSERKAAGELVPGAKPAALADFCIAIMQGGMLLTKMKRDTDMFENAAAQALAYLKTLRVRRARSKSRAGG